MPSDRQQQDRQEPVFTGVWPEGASRDAYPRLAPGENAPSLLEASPAVPVYRGPWFQAVLLTVLFIAKHRYPLLAVIGFASLLAIHLTGPIYIQYWFWQKPRLVGRWKRRVFICADLILLTGPALALAGSALDQIAEDESCDDPAVLRTVTQALSTSIYQLWGSESERNPHSFRGVSELGSDGNWSLCRATMVFYQENKYEDVYLGTGWTALTFDYRFVPTNDGQYRSEILELKEDVATSPLTGAKTTRTVPPLIETYRARAAAQDNRQHPK